MTTEYGALLVFDEVMTGFRISYGGAQEHFGVTPDVTTMGKVIGGGLPVGAYGGRRDIMELMEAMATSGTNIHDFKIAALSKTIAFPLDPWGQAGDPRLLLALVFLVVGLTMQLRHNARTGSRGA